MTDRTMQSARRGGAGWLRWIGGDIVAIYRRGGRGVVAAPLLAMIAILPEAAQHVVEIRLGMFDSIGAFRALANDPLRWGFGYVKLAGFLIAILAFARFHATGSVRRALLPPPTLLARAVLPLAAGFAIGWLIDQATRGHPALAAVGAIASFLIQTGLMLLVAAALTGQRDFSWRAALTTHYPAALLLTLYLVIAFAPCQLLHMANHRLALGRPEPLVWTLMAFDALWVGLFASLVGAALCVGAEARLTWRGWRP